jgi:hypothetical protein
MISLVRKAVIVPQNTGSSALIPFTLTSGDTSVILVAWQGAQSVSSITDSMGNIYILGESVSVDTGASMLNASIYYCLDAVGGVNLSLSILFSASTTILALAALDLNGATQPIAFDIPGSGSGSFH